jgi:hypothetical protein
VAPSEFSISNERIGSLVTANVRHRPMLRRRSPREIDEPADRFPVGTRIGCRHQQRSCSGNAAAPKPPASAIATR